MNVFISHCGEDREVKNVLVQKLTEAGVTCFDSDEQCTSDYSEQCIAAIKNCGVFIVIVSDASMKKGYVINEVITANALSSKGELNMLVYKITDAPYTDNFEFQLNHLAAINLDRENSADIVVQKTLSLLND